MIDLQRSPRIVLATVQDEVFESLIDAGAAGSIKQDDLRHCLRKAVTTCAGSTLRAVDDSIILSLGQCASRAHYVELFVVPWCSNKVTTGWLSLSALDASIDSPLGELLLSKCKILESSLLSRERLRYAGDYILRPNSAVVIAGPAINTRHGTGVFNPYRNAQLQKLIVLAGSLPTLSEGKGSIWAGNAASTLQLWSRGMYVACVEASFFICDDIYSPQRPGKVCVRE